MFQRTLRQTTWQMVRNTVAICMAATLQYLLITVKVFESEKSLLLIHKILRLFVNTLTGDERHYVLNRDKLMQTIKIQLSERQTTFGIFFFAFLKSILNFKHLSKKDDPHS